MATPLAVGDVVVCRHNDSRLAVTNGARGRVTAITSDAITLAMTDHRNVSLPVAYARAGALEHAYAITGHLAQAATFDAAMVIAPPHHHTQQWSYTALSRSHTRRNYSYLPKLIETNLQNMRNPSTCSTPMTP